MVDHHSDRDDLTRSLSSAAYEVTDDRNACLDSYDKSNRSRWNPLNALRVKNSTPAMEEGRQAFHDHVHVSGRSRRHCHKPLDNSTNAAVRRQLLSVTILCLLFMMIETAGGILANSLALFSDVLHLGSDLINFLVCLLAHWLARKPVTRKMTFGYHRAEILGAFFSVMFIWVVSGVLCYIAADRIIHGHYTQVKPDEMLITAAMGLVFNIVMAVSLHSDICCSGIHARITLGHSHSDQSEKGQPDQESVGVSVSSFDDEKVAPQKSDKEIADSSKNKTVSTRPRNINVRAAFIHVVGDTIQSLGVLLSALVIKFAPNQAYKLADPICTFIFSLVVLITTLAILGDVLTVFMEGVPRGMTFVSLKKDLAAVDGVVAVHSLNIWALTLDKTAVAVHLVIEHLHLHDDVLTSATRLLQDEHHVHFTTIQVELYDQVMNSCEDCLRFNT